MESFTLLCKVCSVVSICNNFRLQILKLVEDIQKINSSRNLVEIYEGMVEI